MQMRHLAQESGTPSSAHPGFLATVNLAAAASPRRLGGEARLLYTCSNDLLSGLRVTPAFLGLTTLNGKNRDNSNEFELGIMVCARCLRY